MTKRLMDGTLIYSYPDQFSAATWGGKDIVPYLPVEIFLMPDGWGRVTLRISLDTASVDGAGGRIAGQGKTLVDGTYRTFTYWGNVTVTP